MRGVVKPFVGLVVLGWVSGAFGQAQPPEVIREDTTWTGRRTVARRMRVSKGATLTVAPGSEVTFEEGEVLACQIPLTGRVDRADAESYDPVAERLLVWLIEGPPIR